MNIPERIYNVSQTQLSVARFYGGCKLQGADYHYDAESDTLTRMDIWQERIASDKEAGKKAAKAERDKWADATASWKESSHICYDSIPPCPNLLELLHETTENRFC